MNAAIKLMIPFVFALICLVGCENKEASTHISNNQLKVWADTITYDVLIHNPDSLNNWESNKVKHVKQKELVNDLFELIYSGKKKAYHYYTNEKLSTSDIKELEQDPRFDRDKVGKLQFKETWLFSQNYSDIHKEIHEILLAYEIYDDSGNLRGYKAAFYLKDF